MPDAAPPAERVFRVPGFLPFWAAETVSEFGTYITTMAIQVLVVVTLAGTAADVGLVNAARWLPYILLGLVAGALLDRWRRKPVMVVTDVGRAVLLGLIPLLWALDRLSIATIAVVVALFGVLSLANDSASQSFLPRLVPRSALLVANARLEQSSAVAQTSGPVVAGGLVSLVGAPLAVLADAVSYLVSAVVVARIRITEPAGSSGPRPRIGRDMAEGLRWVYRHRTLAPLAYATHGWFLFNSVLGTVFVPFALTQLGFSAFELGLVLACAGVGGLIGSSLSTRLGLRWGAGRAVIGARFVEALGWALIAAVPLLTGADGVATLVYVGLGQLLYGLAMGAEGANEMGYWQAMTPDAMQTRMNATRRSMNRAFIVIGAPLGGLLADRIGFVPVLWIAVVGFVVAALGLALTPFRGARHGEAVDEPAERPVDGAA
ncbi:major facilitator superfamily MFS_1 [Beutenbergia cavernae DSM 12333]|uniref:Major facilitator superfamily MFS_1 n=1 Tax=Beutenbergia cavernae (strain ATCC BAA-8 / DSM 12333 / CCUG 43141 / JCM 11478 / NBRC 16432 / NCIMB 13614 / HKI 0122) TaxID=471853 RepID=C5C5Y4_BEUC1|nr:MFS transporter [Beutenbergia cavernae]ACQ82342.1 major facilitator superfamily MFS_1 [Beutenbergia cavernae DSM 12333]